MPDACKVSTLRPILTQHEGVTIWRVRLMTEGLSVRLFSLDPEAESVFIASSLHGVVETLRNKPQEILDNAELKEFPNTHEVGDAPVWCPACGSTDLRYLEDVKTMRTCSRKGKALLVDHISASLNQGRDNARLMCLACSDEFAIPEDLEISFE